MVDLVKEIVREQAIHNAEMIEAFVKATTALNPQLRMQDFVLVCEQGRGSLFPWKYRIEVNPLAHPTQDVKHELDRLHSIMLDVVLCAYGEGYGSDDCYRLDIERKDWEALVREVAKQPNCPERVKKLAQEMKQCPTR